MSFLNFKQNENKNLTKSKIVEITIVKNLDEINRENVESAVVEEKRKVLITKVPLGKYEELSCIFEKFFDLFREFLKKQGIKNPDKYIEKELDTQELIRLIPQFLSSLYKFAVDEVIEFVIIGTGLDEDFVRENIDLEEGYEIIKAIVQVNGLLKVGKEVKNLIVLPKPLQELAGKYFSES